MTDDTLEILHYEKDGVGRYKASVPGGEAELTYTLNDDDVMVIDHTFTPPEARGKSIARKLTERAVADAKEHQLRVDPQCPYVAKLFDRKPEWASLRA
ncbi:GNAT family N-acetyltransferase [Hyphococcus luteus]|uniref:GNAT family N-acetyltransferase n=1 Tax=Hyphococcus luteus TaxID=2058213 RepID=A0A2S7K9K5_9PROT|nr:GNAT family N-acetyltransferase [Marinicaulis flavus]PQA89161.1 GNAT family N-acetyltransferase [Marinicaulis flavus]